MDVEKRSKLMRIGIIALFVIILIFLIWRFISGIIDNYQESKQTVVASIDNIDDYIVEVDAETTVKSNLVTTYSTFYTMQNAFENFIEALIDGKYEETYSIVTQDIKAKYDKSTYVEKIRSYTEDNFISSDSSNIYSPKGKLKYLYLVRSNVYIGKIEDAYGNLVKIGISVDTSENTYKVFYIGI